MPLAFHYGRESPLPASSSPVAQIKKNLEVDCSNILGEPSNFHIERRDNLIMKRHGRAILTDEQAQAIFRHKPTALAQGRDKAGYLAKMYGVSIKTIRDIWVGRTWYSATFHMDHAKPFAPERLGKKAGRPKGSKDSKPRSRKTHAEESDESRIELLMDNTDLKRNLTCEQRQDTYFQHVMHRAPSVSAKWEATPFGHADSRSWTDFPLVIPPGGFEDPFREDWEHELALQCSTRVTEIDSCGDWSGEDQAIGAVHRCTAYFSACLAENASNSQDLLS
jgi:hypothetical protein